MEDLINREAAIETLWRDRERLEKRRVRYLEAELPTLAYDCKLERNRVEEDIALLRDVPSAQPERKTGRWILHTYMPHKKYCSCCNADSPYNTRWDYCPNCGAKMEVEHE